MRRGASCYFFLHILKSLKSKSLTLFEIVSREVHVPKSLISKIFEPFLKSCTSEVRVPRGRVPRGLTVLELFLTEKKSRGQHVAIVDIFGVFDS